MVVGGVEYIVIIQYKQRTKSNLEDLSHDFGLGLLLDN